MLTYDDQSVFTFDLNESLWFEKGQEVEEIMGISLEPEISIQEFDDYVSVRGVIELKGEYFQVRDREEEEQLLSLRDHPSQRFVDRVESYEDGVNEFFHNFPVEVSIPRYRISSLDEVMVGIESFDYELSKDSQLKLNATIAIHGVMDEREQEQEVEQESIALASDQQPEPEPDIEPEPREELNELQFDEPIPEPPEPPTEDTFEFDVKEKNEPEQVEPEVVDTAEDAEMESPQAKTTEKDRWKNKKSQSFAEFFGQFDKEAGDEHVEEGGTEVEESSSESDIVSFTSYGKEESNDIESSREAEVKRDTTYLLNIFGGEEEERVTSMKMCIVQESDTLESIAEKYNVTTMQLSNTNKLENEELYEGQLLYIPSKVTKI